MKKFKLSPSEFVTNIFVFSGILIGLAAWWRDIEIWVHGSSQESIVDTIICIIISIIFTKWLSKWRNSKEEVKINDEDTVSEAS